VPTISNTLLFNLIFLPIIFFIGFTTSYEDFKFSKIKNKWILIGLLYPFLIYLFSWILYMLAIKKIIPPYLGWIASYLIWNFDKWCINLVISSLVAYLLWNFKLWAAGDAKLFICYSSLIPMGKYSRVYFNYYFASFLLLLAIFIPATIYLLFRSIFYFLKRFKLMEIREKLSKLIKEKLRFNKIEMGKVILGFVVFFLFFKILRKEFQNLIFKILPSQNILILASLLFFNPLSKFFKKNAKFIVIAFVVLIIYFGFKMVYSDKQFILETGDIFGRSISIMVLFPVFKKLIDLYEERTLQKTTPFAIWMFLGVLIIWFF